MKILNPRSRRAGALVCLALLVATGSASATVARERNEHGANPQALTTALALADRLRLQDDYPSAMQTYCDALTTAEQAGDRAGSAACQLGIGRIFILQTRFSHAVDALRRAHELADAAGDATTAAWADAELGYVYYRLYYYDAAETRLERAITSFTSRGEKAGLAAALNTLGRSTYSRGSTPANAARALDCYLRSVALAEAADAREVLASALSNLGNLYADRARPYAPEVYDEAARRAIDAWRAAGDVGLPEQLDLRAKARAAYDRSLAICEANGLDRKRGVVLGNIGRWYRITTPETFEDDKARMRDYYLRAIDVLARIGCDDELCELYENWPCDTAEQSLTYNAKALEVAERLTAAADGDGLTLQRYLRARYSLYLVRTSLLLARLDRPREAFATIDGARARVLRGLLLGGDRSREPSRTAGEMARSRDLEKRLAASNSAIVAEARRSRPDARRIAALRADREDVRRDLLDLHAEISSRGGLGRRLGAATISVADAATLVPDATTALVEFVVCGGGVFSFVFTKPRGEAAPVDFRWYWSPVPMPELYERVARLRRQILNRDETWRPTARGLYDVLLGPAREQLRDATSLVVVPDRMLWDLPFQTLVDEDDRPLVESRAISCVPSLAALAAIHTDTAAGVRSSLLAFGNPALAAATVDGARERFRGASLEPLPESEDEVRAIGSLYEKMTVLVGSAAREDVFKATAGEFDVLHLATHGIMSDESPMFSAVLLAGGGGEDGLLEAWEIMRLRLRAKLVVLSACETARGENEIGEGMMGLSWAFLVAGSRAVVVSQWPVESTSTEAMMVAFHRELEVGAATKAEALRRAEMAVMRTDGRRHPFYWAGFSVVGDGR